MSDAKKIALILKKDKRYDRIIEQLLKKYTSYGRASGKVKLQDANADECAAAAEMICPKIGYEPPVLSFAVKDFENGLRLVDVTLKEVLEEYYDCVVHTKAEIMEAKKQRKTDFEQELYSRFADTPCEMWLKAMFMEKKYGYRIVMQKYRVDMKQAMELLNHTCLAVNSRYDQNNEPIALAVLSANITGNSHYFDTKETAGGLLINALAFFSNKDNYDSTEEIKSIYSDFGIETDTITGAIATVGIRLFKKDSSEHTGYKYFADNGEIAMISAANLDNILSVDTDRKLVFAVENPAVFTALIPIAVQQNVGLICTSGQLKMVAYKLVDMLVESKCFIYYAGDHDPEGIQIADKLISRYDSGFVKAWRMDPQDYIRIEKREAISSSRLKILDGIKDGILRSLSVVIKKEKKAGYQELLIDEMKNDIINIHKN